MTAKTTVYCDSPSCERAEFDGGLWLRLQRGSMTLHFCDWQCLAQYAACQWEPSTGPANRRKRPLATGAPFLRDAVQEPLPGVP